MTPRYTLGVPQVRLDSRIRKIHASLGPIPGAGSRAILLYVKRALTARRPRGRRLRWLPAALAALALAIVLAVGVEADPDPGVSSPAPARGHRQRPLPTAGAEVTVSPRSPLVAVPRSYLGVSTEYWALPLWSSEMPLLERALSLVHVPRSGPLVLRVGGDSADRSFWDPQSLPMPDWAFTIAPSWLDQARQLVRRLGVKLILDLNLITDSLPTATQWARAAETRLPRGSILAFEVGNEPDIYSRTDWLEITDGRRFEGKPFADTILPAALTKRDYVRDFRGYAAALEQVAPGTILAGPALANPIIHHQWVPTLIDGADHTLGMVTIHRYPYSGCIGRRYTRSYATIARVLSPQASTGMAASLAPLVDDAHDAGLPLRLTELNSVNCGGRSGVSNAFATALWAPDALFALLRAGVDGVNIHVRADTINAPFALTPKGLDARPLLYGLILFARALGPHAQLVEVSARHPRSLNLGVWAVRVGRDTLHIVLIDKGRRPVRATLRLPAVGAASVQRLTAPSAASEDGVTLNGQQLDGQGRWEGVAVHQTITPVRGRYTVDVRRQSAALISVRVAPGALGEAARSPATHGTAPTGDQRPLAASRQVAGR
jgi:Glycosyl hydrolase family 79 C-terminal beta domain